MKGHKLVADSVTLGRRFHADVFEPVGTPEVLVVFIGGSGKSQDEYLQRADVLSPALDPVWQRLGDFPITCIYLTAPFDIPYARPYLFEEHVERRNDHIDQEILAHWPDLPVHLVTYSGGIALALSGAHELSRVRGATGIGADGIPGEFEPPTDRGGSPIWALDLHYNTHDPVYAYNREAVEELVDRGDCRFFRERAGGHAFTQ